MSTKAPPMLWFSDPSCSLTITSQPAPASRKKTAARSEVQSPTIAQGGALELRTESTVIECALSIDARRRGWVK